MNEALPITRLTPTQGDVRRPAHVHALTEALKRGEPLTAPLNPIRVARFEDGALYVHNGHHRVTACVLAGRDHLRPEEYAIQDWTYAQYLEINWSAHYLTPFHPPTETRVADLTRFRASVTFVETHSGRKAAEAFILRHTHLYKRRRCVATFVELAALACAAREAAALTGKGERA